MTEMEGNLINKLMKKVDEVKGLKILQEVANVYGTRKRIQEIISHLKPIYLPVSRVDGVKAAFIS
jgi:hypothetical protein